MDLIQTDPRFRTEYPFELRENDEDLLIADQLWNPVTLWGIVGEVFTQDFQGIFGGCFKKPQDDSEIIGHLVSGLGGGQLVGTMNDTEIQFQIENLWHPNFGLEFMSSLKLTKTDSESWGIEGINGWARIFPAVENSFWLSAPYFHKDYGWDNVEYQTLSSWNPIFDKVETSEVLNKGIVGWTGLSHHHSYLTGRNLSAMAVGGLIVMSDNNISGILTDIFGISTIESLEVIKGKKEFTIVKQYVASYPEMMIGSAWPNIILNVSVEEDNEIIVWTGDWYLDGTFSEKGEFKFSIF